MRRALDGEVGWRERFLYEEGDVIFFLAKARRRDLGFVEICVFLC